MINHYADVAAFNEACGVYRVKTFGDPLPPEELAMRRRLVTEEWHELKDAIAANDRVEIADACADLAYVALGWCWAIRVIDSILGKTSNLEFSKCGASTHEDSIELLDSSIQCARYANVTFIVFDAFRESIHLGNVYGFPMDDVWREVHRSNMAKVVNGKVNKRADGKIVKPKGWTPPDIRGILEREGAL